MCNYFWFILVFFLNNQSNSCVNLAECYQKRRKKKNLTSQDIAGIEKFRKKKKKFWNFQEGKNLNCVAFDVCA